MTNYEIVETNGRFKVVADNLPVLPIDTTKLVKWRGSGTRYYLAGDPEVIEQLHCSASNWGAIDGDNVPKQLGDYYHFFTINVKKLLRWRLNVEMTRFDPDRIKTPGLHHYIKNKVRQWWSSINDDKDLAAQH